MQNPKRKSAAGFTLVEIMVATAISLVLVLGVVQIATSSIGAYNNAMSVVSTTAISRQVLDTLESDLQSAVIKSDGNLWLECYKPDGSDGPADPTANSNFDAGACNSLVLFTTPIDRDRFKPGATGANRMEYRGDVCAVRYRLMNDTPLPTGLSSEDKAYCLNRVIVNPEDTFNQVMKVSTDPTNTQTIAKILASITVDGGTAAARQIKQNSPADIFGMNVVGMTPVFIFKRTDSSKTPSSWYFYAAPHSTVNDAFLKANLTDGFGSYSSPTSCSPIFFTNLKISGGLFTDSPTKPTETASGSAYTPGQWNSASLAAVLVSITVVDDTGANEIRAAQTRGGASGKISEDEWNRIIREHGHSFTRRIAIPGN